MKTIKFTFLRTDNGLTKENFFNAIKAQCPHAMKRFNLFIDNEKQKPEWYTTVRYGLKFHSMPFEMQVGYMIKFFSTWFPKYPEVNMYDKNEVAVYFAALFISVENIVAEPIPV